MRRPFCICRKSPLSGHMTNTAHLRESHDQYRTLLKSRDEYRTLFDTTNTTTVLHFVFIWMTHWVAFVNASALVGDAKRLRLPCFDGYWVLSDGLLPFAWFSKCGNTRGRWGRASWVITSKQPAWWIVYIISTTLGGPKTLVQWLPDVLIWPCKFKSNDT